jgi:hypothetical protein
MKIILKYSKKRSCEFYYIQNYVVREGANLQSKSTVTSCAVTVSETAQNFLVLCRVHVVSGIERPLAKHDDQEKGGLHTQYIPKG